MDIVLKGVVCCSTSPGELRITEGGYLVCQDGTSGGVYTEIPDKYKAFPVKDYGECLIIPGLCDLHTHAPQYAYRGLGMSTELLEWLSTYTYPEEAKYSDSEYAERAYAGFAEALSRSATARACIFATVHPPATVRLMEMLEDSGVVSYVGLVAMDRNCPEALLSKSPQEAFKAMREWIELAKSRFERTMPIITPRFIPACSDELMHKLSSLQKQYGLPVQSHMSENVDEIKWVRELSPGAGTYAGAYERFGLFGGDAATIMAHCVWCEDEDKRLLRDNGVYVAHCPGSNMNIASGIAPVREFMSRGIRVGLGSDVAGGTHLSIFRAITDAVQVSKLYRCHIDKNCAPLTFSEAFYLATAGGGSFFGKCGSFESGYEFDAVVLDDSFLQAPRQLTAAERLERLVYLGDERCIADKYVRGNIINL